MQNEPDISSGFRYGLLVSLLTGYYKAVPRHREGLLSVSFALSMDHCDHRYSLAFTSCPMHTSQ
jgi:hypothetical protein